MIFFGKANLYRFLLGQKYIIIFIWEYLTNKSVLREK